MRLRRPHLALTVTGPPERRAGASRGFPHGAARQPDWTSDQSVLADEATKGRAMLFHLCYVSTQSRPMHASDLVELLNTIRAQNSERDITGLLLHREDSFLQVLEGEEDDVRQTFDRIKRDRRHRRIKVLFEEPLEEREFSDWRMGFVELDGVDVKRLPGFSDFLVDDSEPRRFLEELTQAKRFLLLFRAMH